MYIIHFHCIYAPTTAIPSYVDNTTSLSDMSIGAIVMYIYLYIIFMSNICHHTADSSLKHDPCCFSETSSTEISCNVTVSGLNTSMVGSLTVPLQLKPTDHNLVCQQNLLSVIVETTTGSELCTGFACSANHTST